jgi:AraC-like DNA-binding protein
VDKALVEIGFRVRLEIAGSLRVLQNRRQMKTLEPNITVRALQPVCAGLTALGHDVAAMLALARIQPSILDDSDGRIPHSSMISFWNIAGEETGDQDIGIHVAEAAPTDAFSVHAYAVLSSPNLREAYRRSCRYQRLIHEATNLELDEGAGEAVLRHSLPGGRCVPRQPAEFLMAIYLRFGRLVVGREWSPTLVCFDHDAPADTSEHSRVFAATVRFSSGVTSLHVVNEILDEPAAKGDPALLAIMDSYAAGLLEKAPGGPALSERIRTLLQQGLQDGVPTAEEAAAQLNMSVRSLHRGLKAEGSSYRGIADQLRHEQASSMLADPRYSTTEVGYLLGFSEISSFHRAFKRWAGVTPAEFRSDILPAPSPAS